MRWASMRAELSMPATTTPIQRFSTHGRKRSPTRPQWPSYLARAEKRIRLTQGAAAEDRAGLVALGAVVADQGLGRGVLFGQGFVVAGDGWGNL